MVKIIWKNINKALWDQEKIAICHHKLVNCSSLSNVSLLHYFKIQQQTKIKGTEDSSQIFSWTFQDYAIFLLSLSLCLAEAQVLADPNLFMMPDFVLVVYYIVERWNMSACCFWSEVKFLEGVNGHLSPSYSLPNSAASKASFYIHGFLATTLRKHNQPVQKAFVGTGFISSE